VPKIIENKGVQETLNNFPELSKLLTEWRKEQITLQLRDGNNNSQPEGEEQ
jgi:hypothetical protein